MSLRFALFVNQPVKHGLAVEIATASPPQNATDCQSRLRERRGLNRTVVRSENDRDSPNMVEI